MDATQFLEFLTARTIPYKFPNGVPLAKIKGDARQHPDWENLQELEAVIGTLQNYYTSSEMRKVESRQVQGSWFVPRTES